MDASRFASERRRRIMNELSVRKAIYNEKPFTVNVTYLDIPLRHKELSPRWVKVNCRCIERRNGGSIGGRFRNTVVFF